MHSHQDTMSCLSMVDTVAQQKDQESDETDPPVAFSRTHRLSDNHKMTETPTLQHYSVYGYAI